MKYKLFLSLLLISSVASIQAMQETKKKPITITKDKITGIIKAAAIGNVYQSLIDYNPTTEEYSNFISAKYLRPQGDEEAGVRSRKRSLEHAIEKYIEQ